MKIIIFLLSITQLASSNDFKKFDLNRLQYIDSLSNKLIKQKEFTGVSVLVKSSNQSFYNKNFGFGDIEKQTPIDENTMFRIFSMTKPVTSVALMILVERGLLNLFDPISMYLPEFKNMKKINVINLPIIKHLFNFKTKVKNQITIFHLLTHTSGMYYDFSSVYGSVYNEYIKNPFSIALLSNIDRSSIEEGSLTLEKFSQEMAKLPLLFEPGSDFNYGISTAILGRIIEVVSKKSFEDFLKDEIFIPLDMFNTSFNLNNEVKNLNYIYENNNGEMVKSQTLNDTMLNSIPLGGVGLISNISDYSRFCEMLLNKGSYKNRKILSKNSIELMTKNHIKYVLGNNANSISMRKSNVFIDGVYETIWNMDGFGLGFSLNENISHQMSIASNLRFGWMGAANTFFFIDPKNDFYAIIMAQSLINSNLIKQYENVIYQALN